MMTLKPSRSNQSLSPEFISQAEVIADKIESLLNLYAEETYGKGYLLERFTEVAWNVIQKPALFSSDQSMLVQVVLRHANDSEILWHPKADGFYLEIHFYVVHYYQEDLDSQKVDAIRRTCQALSSLTGLQIRCFATDEIPQLLIV